MILIDIPGKPIPFKSPHVGARGTFNPRWHEAEQVKHQIREQYLDDIIDGPVEVWFMFYFEIPVSWSKKKRLSALNGHIQHTSTPDRGNCLKFYEDCLQGTVIKNDSCIVGGDVRKEWSTKSHTLIKIIPLNLAVQMKMPF